MSAIVTGGTKGVGLEIVKKFTKLNIPTLFTGRNISELEYIEHQLGKDKVKGIPLEMSNKESIQSFITEVKEFPAKPKYLIHNAGYLSLHKKETTEHLQKLFMVNTLGPMMITQELLSFLKLQKEAHILFFSPPYKIDQKVKYLTPYMQSKLAQTTYMKSLSFILNDYPISVNSMWTKYPLWTDAIEKRSIGEKEKCMHPAIISEMVEKIITTENPNTFKGNELFDKTYLKKKNINVKKFQMGKDLEYLDEMFMKKLV